MNNYLIKVTCEYYVEVEAKSERGALKKAEDYAYDGMNDSQNFKYEVVEDEEDGE